MFQFGAYFLIAAASVCGRPEWDRDSRQCLAQSGLSQRYGYFAGQVSEFAVLAGISEPTVRPTVLLIRGRTAEVERLKNGHHEVRVDAEDLTRSRRSLRYIAAHEVCHIVNGDTDRGIWAQLTQERRDERHRWVEACAYDLMGNDAYASYLSGVCGADLVRHLAVLTAVRLDAELWNTMRRQAHAAVP